VLAVGDNELEGEAALVLWFPRDTEHRLQVPGLLGGTCCEV